MQDEMLGWRPEDGSNVRPTPLAALPSLAPLLGPDTHDEDAADLGVEAVEAEADTVESPSGGPPADVPDALPADEPGDEG